MPDAAFIEKRGFPRFAIGIPLTCQTNTEKVLEAHTHDISAGGLGIITEEEVPAGTAVDACLRIVDDSGEIYRKGKVVWSSPVAANKYRAGVQLEKADLKPIPIVLRTIKAKRQY
jgi:Tfp pilus assembly protein PilZ